MVFARYEIRTTRYELWFLRDTRYEQRDTNNEIRTMAALIIKGAETKIIPIHEDIVTIGRDQSNIVKLDDKKVSRKHCRIENEGEKFWIQDLDSSHGTLVNESLIKDWQELKDGDELKLGNTIITFTLNPSDKIIPSMLGSIEAPEFPPKAVSPTSHFSLSPPVVGVVSDPDKEKRSGLIHPAHTTAIPPQKKLEELLNEALFQDQQNLRALYEITQAISSVFDLKELLNRILDVALKAIRAERGFIMLKDEKTGDLIPKAVRNRDAQKITISKTIVDKVFETGESVMTDDAMLDERFSDGKSIVDYQIRSCLCVPLKSKDKILGIIHVDNKVSTRKFTEDDLELLSAVGAEAGVVVENAELYKANLKAERLAAIGQTIAGLSHCIKNILMGVEGGAALVEAGIAKGNQKLLKKGWKIVRSSDERISQLVLNMLDFSKEREPVCEKSNVNDIVRDVVSILEEKCRQKSIKIETILDENIPEIEIDPIGIHRSILNIAANAVDAVSTKIIFTTSLIPEDVVGELARPSCHSCESGNPAGKIQITISDNGCGISDEDIPKLFDIFHSTKGSEGTGLGLAVAKKIIDEHKGEIKVTSKVGQGTAFTIILYKKT